MQRRRGPRKEGPVASDSFDLAVVGAGIVGLAHALAAARLGKRVVVIDRGARANGASVRNFGFVTVTGQQRGECWRRARRSRDVWAEIALLAGIRVEQRGLLMVARRPEARAVLEAFLATEMGEGCELLEPATARARCPQLAAGPVARPPGGPPPPGGGAAPRRGPCSRPSSPPRWARAASCWSRLRPGRAARSSRRDRSPAPCGARTTCGSSRARLSPHSPPIWRKRWVSPSCAKSRSAPS